MASENIVADPGGTSRAGFFTPASSASLLDELENQSSGVSALPHSIVFPHTECMLSAQGMDKERLPPDRTPALQQGHSACCLPTDAVPVRQSKLSGTGAERYVTEVPQIPAAETCTMISKGQTGANRCCRSRGTASLGARKLQIVERQVPQCVSPIGPIPRGNMDGVNRRRDGHLERLPTEEKGCLSISSGERPNGSIPAKVLKEPQKPKDCKDMGCFHTAMRTDGFEGEDHSLLILKENLSESSRFSVDVTGADTWVRFPISTFIRTEGACPRSPALPLQNNSSLEQACVRSSSNRSEASTSLRRLGKCASTASTVCTANSEPLYDAGWEGKRDTRRSRHLLTLKSDDGGCIEGYDSNLPECTFRRRTRVQVPHLSRGHSASYDGETCAASLKDEDSTRAVQLSLAAGPCGRHELPYGPSPMNLTTTDATESSMGHGSLRSSLRWTEDLPVRPEAHSFLPIRSNRERPPVRDVSNRLFSRDVRVGFSRDEETGAQPISDVARTSCGHCEKLPSTRNCSSNNAALNSSVASGLKCTMSLDTPCEVNRLKKLGRYAEPEEDNIRTVRTEGAAALRTTPIFQRIQCVLKPSFSFSLTYLFNGGDAAGEPCHQHDRQPRRISEAKHSVGSHIRKARRYTECAEWIRSASKQETHALATHDKWRHSASLSTHMEPACRLQQPFSIDMVNFRPPFQKDQSVNAKKSGTNVDLERQRRETGFCSSLSDLSCVSSISSEPFICTPLKGREIVKKIGSHLSTFERREILDYEEVWYWGRRRTTCPDEVQRFNDCNSGFDDARGDYLAILGDHICYRFEVLTPLGRGSFGQVFSAFDHKKKEQVALKIVRNKSHFHAQGRIEIQVLQELAHHDTDNKANVIHMKEHFLFRNHLVITFELLSVNVYDFLKRNFFKGLSSLAVRSIAIQLLQALRLLRRQRIVHCDLKPENIVLKNVHKSGVKVIDFGSSCREGEMRYSYIQSRFYRSPEVILGLTYNCAIDMWSLGCILAELQTGQPLFPGENEADQINCVMEVLGPPPNYLISQSPKRKVFFKANGEPKTSASPHGKKRKISSRELTSALRTDDLRFVEFIRDCLQWDPARRMTPDEALQHEWIQEFKRLRQRKQVS